MSPSSGDHGDVLGGRYLIEREIGRGGMATVYLAHDLRHDARVAVKLLRDELASPTAAERFVREIRITARLQHPNILAIFDSGTHEGLPFYVMPYVEGETLEDRLRREGGPLPVDEAVEIASEIADALQFAHELGFVHRDVKPANILLSHGHALLADFGVARAIDAAGSPGLTETRHAVGTVKYMSPEQAVGGAVDARSDLYALGCVIYEMLTGGPPFSGPAQVVMARHVGDTVPSIAVARAAVPEALERAVLRALAKIPADRHGSAAELRSAIREASAGEAGAPRREVRGRARRVTIAAAVPALVLIALGSWYLRPRAALDTNRVMVFPLQLPAGFTGPQSAGEDAATMIGSGLDGVGPLRLIDGAAYLEPELRADVRGMSRERARALAISKDCGYFLTGRITPIGGDSVEVTLVLNETRSDSQLATESDPGPATDAWRHGLRAVNKLLPRLIPGITHDAEAEFRDRPPRAIASFLLAESHFRRVQLVEALEDYRAAVEADTTFSLAAIRGAQAAMWTHEPDRAASLVDIALRQDLEPRYERFARGYVAYLEGRADSAAAEFRRVIAAEPDITWAWMQLGEVYVHLLPSGGNPDSLGLIAFTRALELDPTAVNLAFHPSEILLRRGDLARATPIAEQYIAGSGDPDGATKISLMLECVRDGPAAIDWDARAARDPLPVLTAAASLVAGLANAPCAEAGFDAVLRVDTAATGEADGRRWGALVGRTAALLARGDTTAAVEAIEETVARWGYGRSLYLFAAPFVPAFRDSAYATARMDAELHGTDYRSLRFSTRLWELGVLETQRRRLDVARAVADELDARSADTESREGRMARSVRAHVALAEGDTAAALRLLEPLVPSPVPGGLVDWDEAEPFGFERLIFARLLAARGEHERALEIARVFDTASPLIYALFVPESLTLRAELSEALNEHRDAAGLRLRLEALRAGER